MDAILRHFWIAAIVVTVVNGRAWWSRVQGEIRAHADLEPGYRSLYRGYHFWMNLPWLFMGVGIVTHHVASVVDFLRPSEGNPFVLAWYGLWAAELCLGTYWIFAGGAEMLERHPGVYMVPRWPASRLRIFWLGLVAWNAGIAGLLFLGFPDKLAQQNRPFDGGAWIASLFPFCFVGLWLLVCFLLSAMGGWRSLGQRYATSGRFSGKRFRFRSAQLGGYVNYGSCLTLGSSNEGLYLAILPPFRLAHPPLLIPWSDVTAQVVQGWVLSSVELAFAKAPGVSVRFSRRLAQSLFEAAETHVVVQPAA